MDWYYLNINREGNPNQNYEVHISVCRYCPNAYNRIDLGIWNDGVEAVLHAKSLGYAGVDGCKHCCIEAHYE